MLVMALGFVMPSESKAQKNFYKTTAFASQKVVNGSWGKWSDWQDSNMDMVIDLDNDIVTIDSPTKQVYYITEYVGNFTDNSGGKQVEFAFKDQDGDRGHMRLRIETNGNSQVYIDFSNVRWCYNVRRVR